MKVVMNLYDMGKTAGTLVRVVLVRWYFKLCVDLIVWMPSSCSKLQPLTTNFEISAIPTWTLLLRTIYENCCHSQQKTVFSCFQVAATLHSPRVKNHEPLKQNLSF